MHRANHTRIWRLAAALLGPAQQPALSRAGWLFAAAVAVAATQAQADDIAEFDRARGLYERNDYKAAAADFANLVGTEPPRLKNTVLVAESRKYWAASLLFLGDEAGARAAFGRLLAQDPDYAIDPLAFPRDVVTLFEEMKRRDQEERARAAESVRARDDEARRIAEEIAARDRAMLAQLRALAEQSQEEKSASRFIATVPFGVGQFQNGHRGLGTVLAMAQGISAVTSVVAYVYHQNLAAKHPATESDAGPLRELERVMRLTNIASFSVFAGLAVVGVVDAHVRFVERRVTSRPRTLPGDLDRWLKERGLALSADGLHF